jgi:hypothetical protein
VLLQLAEFTDTRADALTQLDALEDALNKYVPAADTASFDAAVRDVLARRRAADAPASVVATGPPAAGLEHLANAAVADAPSPSVDTAMVDGPADGSGVAVAAAAEAAAAAAKAAQAQMGGGREFKGEYMSTEGYLVALMG